MQQELENLEPKVIEQLAARARELEAFYQVIDQSTCSKS
jgi:hypothetical protein